MKEVITFVLCIIGFGAILIFLEAAMFLLSQLFYVKSEHEKINALSNILEQEKISELHQRIDNNIKTLFKTTIGSLLIAIICLILANMITPLFK